MRCPKCKDLISWCSCIYEDAPTPPGDVVKLPNCPVCGSKGDEGECLSDPQAIASCACGLECTSAQWNALCLQAAKARAWDAFFGAELSGLDDRPVSLIDATAAARHALDEEKRKAGLS